MVFGIRGPWSTTTPGSDSKLNGMMIIEGPGDDLTGLDKTVYKHIYCTVDETAGGLLAGHRYHASVDELSWVDETGVIDHTHTGTDDGGNVVDIFRANPLYQDLYLSYLNAPAAKWVEGVTGTGGAVSDDTDGTTGERSLKLVTGATTTSTDNIKMPELMLDFSLRSFYQTKVRIGTFSSIAIHTGVQVDRLDVADSNTRKYGAEICTATNNNWFARSATGAANSASDTTITATANRTALRMEHYPDLGTPEVDLYIDANAVFQKTTDIPVDGATSETTLVRHAVKNSTGADRPFYIYGTRVCYYVADTWV